MDKKKLVLGIGLLLLAMVFYQLREWNYQRANELFVLYEGNISILWIAWILGAVLPWVLSYAGSLMIILAFRRIYRETLFGIHVIMGGTILFLSSSEVHVVVLSVVFVALGIYLVYRRREK